MLALLLFLLLFTSNSCQQQHHDYDEYSDDYDNNYVDIVESVNCSEYNSELTNCSCTRTLINCTNLGFYSLPTNISYLEDENRTINILFNNNSIKILSEIKVPEDGRIKIKTLNLANNIPLEDVDAFNSTLEILILNDNKNFDLNKLINISFDNLNILHLNNIKSPLVIDNSGFFSSQSNSKIDSLKEISVKDTKLIFSPSSSAAFYNLTNLEVLFLRNNQLNEIPCERIKSFSKLRILKYELNSISTTNENCFKQIEKLYLREISDLNDLEKLFDDSSSKSLKYLDLSRNKMFDGLPFGLLRKLNELRELVINVNEIIEANGTILTDSKLARLDLSNSIIRRISENSFNSFLNLNELNLQNCSIESLDKKAFSGLKHLQHVSFMLFLILVNTLVNSFS